MPSVVSPEMVSGAVQMVITLVTALGAFLGLMLTARA